MERLLRSIEVINSASLEELRDKEFVANVVRVCGLYGCQDPVYGPEKVFGINDGFGVWQMPTQLGCFFPYLSGFKIKSFLEVGSHNGCFAVLLDAYLRRFNPTLTSISVDILDSVLVSDIFPVNFLKGTSSDFKGRSFDLVFIDGGRDYDVVVGHYQNVGKYAKVCAFHDINCRFSPDIIQYWAEIKNSQSIEILDHPNDTDIMGIGILQQPISLA